MTDDELNMLHDLALRFWNEHNAQDGYAVSELDGDAWCFVVALKEDMVKRGLLADFWDRTPDLVER